MVKEKVAIVTAGGSGMGAGAARKLAADGFRVAILSASGKGGALAEDVERVQAVRECIGIGVEFDWDALAPRRVHSLQPWRP